MSDDLKEVLNAWPDENSLNQCESPKQAFDRLLYKTIAPALQDLYAICRLQKAPAEVSQLFSVEPFEPGTIRNLIDRTLEEHPAKFLE